MGRAFQTDHGPCGLDQNDEDFPSETAKQILEVATPFIIASELYFLGEEEDMLLQHGDVVSVSCRYQTAPAPLLYQTAYYKTRGRQREIEVTERFCHHSPGKWIRGAVGRWSLASRVVSLARWWAEKQEEKDGQGQLEDIGERGGAGEEFGKGRAACTHAPFTLSCSRPDGCPYSELYSNGRD